MTPARERRLLQIVVSLCALLPVYAGLSGVLQGDALLLDGSQLGRDGDSHWRYLSGLLLAVGLGFWTCVPSIERKTARLRLLTLIVVCGGLARLYALLSGGVPSPPMLAGVAMELAIAPLVCAWQGRVARRVDG